MKTVYLALGLLLLPGMLWAQGSKKENEFTMSMQIRPRAEYRNGAQLPRFEGDKAASFINNRARLSMEYKRSDLSMKISAQHVGVWGQDPQIDTNGRFIMNEAWAKLNFGAGFFAQLGRQTLSYDDERILGGLDWNVMKDVKLSAGYSIMRGAKSMDVVKGGDHKRWQDWGWVSVNINPRILFVKW